MTTLLEAREIYKSNVKAYEELIAKLVDEVLEKELSKALRNRHKGFVIEIDGCGWLKYQDTNIPVECIIAHAKAHGFAVERNSQVDGTILTIGGWAEDSHGKGGLE